MDMGGTPRRGPFDCWGRSPWPTLALALILAGFAAGCSSDEKDKSATPTQSESSAPAKAEGADHAGDNMGDKMADDHAAGGAPASGVKVGEVAPKFSLATLSGSTFAFPAGKPTAVWFTANGCRPCIPKAQALDRIKAAFGDRLAVLGVDINPTETEAVLKGWLKEVGNPRFDAALDKGGQLAVSWGVKDTSTVVITDSAGKIVFRSVAPDDEARYRAALAEAGLT